MPSSQYSLYSFIFIIPSLTRLPGQHSIVILDDLARDKHRILEMDLALQVVSILLIVPPTWHLANYPI